MHCEQFYLNLGLEKKEKVIILMLCIAKPTLLFTIHFYLFT